MAVKDFQKFNSESVDLNQVQGNIVKYLNQLPNTLLSGNLLSDTVVGTSTTLVPHNLGRKIQGWFLTDKQGNATIWRDATSTEDDTKFLALKASSSVTVKLWVF